MSNVYSSMKVTKFIALMVVCAGLFSACSSNDSTKPAEETPSKSSTEGMYPDSSTTTDKSDAPLAEGAKLMKAADCYSCHNEDVKLVGPSLKQIADKYPANKENIAMLTQKVIAGGQGVWGQVPMLAHPTLAKEDITKMVEYILSLK